MGISNVITKIGAEIIKHAPKIIKYAPIIIDLADKAVKVVKDWFSSDSSDKVSQEKYQSNNSQSIIELSQRLGEVKSNLVEQAKSIESSFIDLLENSFKNISQALEANNIPTLYLKNAIKDGKREIKNAFRNEIATKISIDNTRCRMILELDDDIERQKNFKEFYDSILKDAIYKMQNALRNSMQSAKDNTIEIITHKISIQREYIQNKLNALDELKRNSNIEAKREQQAQILVDIAKTSITLNAIKKAFNH